MLRGGGDETAVCSGANAAQAKVSTTFGENVVWPDALLGLECRKLLGIGRKARLLRA